jgi:hypothetical protein
VVDGDRTFNRTITSYYNSQADCEANTNATKHVIENVECSGLSYSLCPIDGNPKGNITMYGNCLGTCRGGCDQLKPGLLDLVQLGTCVNMFGWKKKVCLLADTTPVSAQGSASLCMTNGAFMLFMLSLLH